MYNINKKRRGLGLIEYGITGGLIALVALVAITSTGKSVKCNFNMITQYLATTPTDASCNDTTPKSIYWIEPSTNTTPIALTVGTAGTTYNTTIPLAMSPTHHPIIYTISQGTLPKGLSFNSTNGIISGTLSNNPNSLAVTSNFQVSATDGVSTVKTDEYIKLPVNGKIIFSYTGSDQTFVMPDSKLKIKVWGAAGGSTMASEYGKGGDNLGGPGGYSYGEIPQGNIPTGTTLTVVVGGGGLLGSGPGAYGGGGRRDGDQPSSDYFIDNGQSNTSMGGGTRGGGESAIRLNNNDIIVAGGGGGVGTQTITIPCNGGAGGGTSGESGDGKDYWGGASGTNGTQTGPGSNDNDAIYNVPQTAESTSQGARDQGGTALAPSGGASGWTPQANGSGGGGYYGGGAGAIAGQGPGGGGSGFIDSNYITNGSMIAGTNGGMPGNSSDTDRPNGIGESVTRAKGNNGAIIISWGP